MILEIVSNKLTCSVKPSTTLRFSIHSRFTIHLLKLTRTRRFANPHAVYLETLAQITMSAMSGPPRKSSGAAPPTAKPAIATFTHGPLPKKAAASPAPKTKYLLGAPSGPPQKATSGPPPKPKQAAPTHASQNGSEKRKFEPPTLPSSKKINIVGEKDTKVIHTIQLQVISLWWQSPVRGRTLHPC